MVVMRFNSSSEQQCRKERGAVAVAATSSCGSVVPAKRRYLLLFGTTFAFYYSYAFAFAFSELSPLISRGNRRLFESTVFLSSKRINDRSSFAEAKLEPTTETQPQTTNGNSHNGNHSDIRFASPLLDFGYPPAVKDYEHGIDSEKPLLLYLPGFDGTYLSAFFQYPELHTICEVRCLVSTMDDRSTFEDLKAAAMEFILKQSQPTETTTTTGSSSSKHNISNNTNIQENANHATIRHDEDGNQNNYNPTIDNAADPTSSNNNTTTTSWWPSLRFLSNMFKGVGITLPTTQKNNATAVTAKTKTTTTTTTTNHKSFQENNKRPVYLVGESFGGILASEIALSILETSTTDINLKGLVLINAATCYDRSRLAAEGPSVARLPKLLYVFGILRLLPMFLDNVSLPQFLAILQGKALPSVIDNPVREAYMGRLAFSLPILLQFMPQETFQWRLEQWLEVGCSRMAWRLKELAKYSSQEEEEDSSSLRTLIIAGEKDSTLPSIAEAERLAQKLPKSFVHIVDGAGHANTCGSRLDMAAVMRNVFEELRPNRVDVDGRAGNEQEGRIAMKPVAAEGKGVYFGMEPRYDGKRFGLSPTKYWSKEYYRKRSSTK